MSGVTVNSIIENIVEDDSLNPQKKIELINEIRKAAPPLHDRWLYRSVVWGLSVAILLVFVLYYFVGREGMSDGIISIGSAAVGALAALITPNGQSKES